MTKYLNDHLMIFVIVLCIAWFFVVAFHLYIRCYGRHISPSTVAGSTHLRHVVRSSDAGRGLDPSVVSALPTFVYDPKTEEAPLECAVCLSEFEGGESGRVMPDCSHRFHTECIDMWLMSHQDCPLCRTRVKVADGAAAPVEDSQEGSVSITIHGSGTVWRSGLHVYFLSG